MKLGSRLATILLAIVSLAHLLRISFQVEILADGTSIPQWVSVPGCVIPATIAVLLWREGRHGLG